MYLKFRVYYTYLHISKLVRATQIVPKSGPAPQKKIIGTLLALFLSAQKRKLI